MEADLKKESNDGIIVVGQVEEPEKLISGVNENDQVDQHEASGEEPEVAEQAESSPEVLAVNEKSEQEISQQEEEAKEEKE